MVMDEFSIKLNDLLVETFRSILKVEEEMLKHSDKVDLSISEMHVIESVGKNKSTGKMISDIAEDLSITLPSVTIAINKLMKKGYVQKVKSENDGRIVFVTLTPQGKKMDAVHRYFHQSMVRTVAKELTKNEKDAMVKGIEKLNAFFKYKIDVMEEK